MFNSRSIAGAAALTCYVAFAAARRLQSALRVFLDRQAAAERRSTKSLVTEFMTTWLDDYEAQIAQVRDRVDTAANVSALSMLATCR